MGKGSRQRPTNLPKYREEYDRIFGVKEEPAEEPIPECIRLACVRIEQEFLGRVQNKND